MASEKKRVRLDTSFKDSAPSSMSGTNNGNNHPRDTEQTEVHPRSKFEIFMSPVKRLINRWEWPTIAGLNDHTDDPPPQQQQHPSLETPLSPSTESISTAYCPVHREPPKPKPCDHVCDQPNLLKVQQPPNNIPYNEPLKEVFYQIYSVATRHDVKHLVLDALVVFFERAYDENRAQILLTHNFEFMYKLVDEVRAQLISNHTNWRHRQWYGLYVEKVFMRMAPKCPPTILLTVFAHDLLELVDEQITLLRQLFPRILRHLNLVYLDYLDCGLPNYLLVRMAELAFTDPDREIRRLSFDAFADCPDSHMRNLKDDDDAMCQFLELTLLSGNKINDLYKPSPEIALYKEPWAEIDGWAPASTVTPTHRCESEAGVLSDDEDLDATQSSCASSFICYDTTVEPDESNA